MCYTTEMQLAKLAENAVERAWTCRNAKGRIVRMEPFRDAAQARYFAEAWNDATLLNGRCESLIDSITSPDGMRVDVSVTASVRRYA